MEETAVKKIYHIITIMIIVFAAVFARAEANSDDTLNNMLKQRVITELTYAYGDELGYEASNSKDKLISKAKQYVGEMSMDSTEYALWKDLSTSVSHVNEAFSRLLLIARASKMYNNAWDENVKSAVKFLAQTYYKGNEDEGNDWWYYEIGIPKSLAQILILEGSKFNKAEIEDLCNVILAYCPHAKLHTVDNTMSETGANLAWKAEILTYCGLLLDNVQIIKDALIACDDLFITVKTGDGFYADGSFIQHSRVPYIGSYGKNLLGSVASIAYAVKGTELDFSPEQKEIIRGWIFDSFAPFMQNGAMMSMVRGRAIARSYETDKSAGRNIIGECAKLSAVIDKENELIDFVRKHISTEDLPNSSYGPFTMQLVENMLSNISVSNEEGARVWLFPSSDRAVFLRNGVKMGISMSSSRIYTFESNAKENYHGWHTGSGMTYLYGKNGNTYDRGFWCTVDPYRLSGTTVDNTQYVNREGAYHLSQERWCGGATLDGKFASIGMSFKQYKSELTGKKSWFCIGNEFIAMGVGITSNGNSFTTIENRIINADSDSIILNGNALNYNEEDANKTYWFNINDNTDSVGYFFPNTDYLNFKVEEREGNWKNIHNASSNSTVKNTFFSAVKKHESGSEGNYVYAILPGAKAEETRLYAKNFMTKRYFEIVANNKIVQSVKNTDVIAANFWDKGSADVISVDREASVVIYDKEGIIKIAASDPTQKAENSVRITVDKTAVGINEKSDEIKVISLWPKIVLDIDTSALLGRSAHIELTKNASGEYNNITDSIFFAPNMKNGILQGKGRLDEKTVVFSEKGNNKIIYQLEKPMNVSGERTYLIEWDQYLGAEIDGNGILKDFDGQYLSFSNAVLGAGFKKDDTGTVKPFLWWYDTGNFADITIKKNTWYHMKIVAELHGERRDKLYLYVVEKGNTVSGIPIAKLEIEGNVDWNAISLCCKSKSEGSAGFANLNVTETTENITEAFYLLETGKAIKEDDNAWNFLEAVYRAFQSGNTKKAAQQIFCSSASVHFNEPVAAHNTGYNIFNATNQIQRISVIRKTDEMITVEDLSIETNEVNTIRKINGCIFLWKSLNSMIPIKCFE